MLNLRLKLSDIDCDIRELEKEKSDNAKEAIYIMDKEKHGNWVQYNRKRAKNITEVINPKIDFKLYKLNRRKDIINQELENKGK